MNFTGVGTPKPVDPTTLSMTINGVAGPVNVANGTKVTLGWTTDNNSVDQSCTATADDTNSTWKGPKPGTDKVANTEQVTVNKTTKYDVTCNSVTRSVTATVQDSVTGTNIRDL